MKRRALLVTGLGAAGALVVGWGVMPPRDRLGAVDALPAEAGEVSLNGWIKIGADGTVMLAMNRSEMGQGTHTALAMLVAEELDVPLARVRLVPAGADRLYGNVATMVTGLAYFHPRDTEPGRETTPAKAGQWVVAKIARELGINVTGGSSSIVDGWEVLRLAAATARCAPGRRGIDRLEAAGGRARRSRRRRQPSAGRSAHYGELARMAAATPTGEVRLKRRDEWRLIGTAAPRIDAAAKSDGSARFGIDVRPPACLRGRSAIARCSAAARARSTSRRRSHSPASSASSPRALRRLAAALAVVGRTSWHAQRGADAIKVEWRQRPAGALDTRGGHGASGRARQEPCTRDGGFAFHSRGDVAAAEAGATRHVEHTYRAPYLAHAAMEPINCTARVAAGRSRCGRRRRRPAWRARSPPKPRASPRARSPVHVTYLGGGFGRRLDVDFVGQAVRIAVETGGRPVQLVWSREEDLMHDFYRPAAVRDPARRRRRRRPAGHAARDERRRRDHAALDRARRPVARRPGRHARQDDERRPVRPALRRAAPAHRPRRDLERRAGRLLALGRSFAQRVLRRVVRRRARARGRPRPGRLPARAAQGRAAPRRGASPRRRARRLARPGPLAAARAGRARGVALHESFGSIVAQVVEASIENGGRACTASSAPPTSAPSSTRASSPSRWKAR
jgi:isoquinoline 1-oxidoreductase beta subunit